MKVSIASPNWSYAPGEIVDLDDYLAQAWIECGHAKSLESADQLPFRVHEDDTEKQAELETSQEVGEVGEEDAEPTSGDASSDGTNNVTGSEGSSEG